MKKTMMTLVLMLLMGIPAMANVDAKFKEFVLCQDTTLTIPAHKNYDFTDDLDNLNKYIQMDSNTLDKVKKYHEQFRDMMLDARDYWYDNEYEKEIIKATANNIGYLLKHDMNAYHRFFQYFNVALVRHGFVEVTTKM